ncbi:hypothetical protein DL770_009269 [Monosporascus sp. CRB-9-2]|nr:hypothetical protein DL770_009269 [Monosporascus sp. CRB-9-2]
MRTRTKALHFGPRLTSEASLTFHVDPLTDLGGWEVVRAEFARALWLPRSAFGRGVIGNALQLVAREALDDCILRSRLGDPRGFHITPRPPLL